MRKITTFVLSTLVSFLTYGQYIQTISYETWSSENWQNLAKYTYTYDSNDYMTNSLNERWDNSTNSYKNSSQSNYTNNGNGIVQQSISQNWNTTTNNWENSQRSTYYYLTLSLTDNYLSNKISVYPNPTSDNLYFSEPVNAILINSVGQILINEKHTSSLTLSEISIGVYILILSNDLGQVQQNKIVKK